MADGLHVSVVKMQPVPPHACMLPLTRQPLRPICASPFQYLGARGSTRSSLARGLINLICLHLAYLSTVRNNTAQEGCMTRLSLSNCFRSTLVYVIILCPHGRVFVFDTSPRTKTLLGK